MIYNPGVSKISSALLLCIAMFAAIGIGDLFTTGEVAFIMPIGAISSTLERLRSQSNASILAAGGIAVSVL